MKELLPVCFYCIFLLRAASTHYFLCPQNEIRQRCGKRCEPTCKNPQMSFCNSFNCQPGCSCKAGRVRDEISGRCVYPEYCTLDCPENEVPSYVGNGCESTCQSQYSMFQCRFQVKRCVCKSGFVRDFSSGKCISTEECSERLSCKYGEVWKACSEHECRETCQRRKPTTCSKICISGCSCQLGYLWDEFEKKCVPKPQCSKVCRRNEDWCQQIPDIVPTCQNILDTECVHCSHPSYVYPRSGCICVKGFIWDEYSQECVRLDQCNLTDSTTELITANVTSTEPTISSSSESPTPSTTASTEPTISSSSESPTSSSTASTEPTISSSSESSSPSSTASTEPTTLSSSESPTTADFSSTSTEPTTLPSNESSTDFTFTTEVTSLPNNSFYAATTNEGTSFSYPTTRNDCSAEGINFFFACFPYF